MKKIMILIMLALFISCSIDIEEVKNPEKNTTVEILSQPRDSDEIVILDNKVYILQDELVKHILVEDNAEYITLHGLFIFLFCVLFWVMLIILIMNW